MSKGTRNLILAMTLVVLAGILFARNHYGRINRSADPRVATARTLYGEYNRVAQSGDFHQLFQLLEGIDSVYLGVPHYAQSFERGVLENNRAAAFLTLALYGDSISPSLHPFPHLEKDSLTALAKEHVLHALAIYESWYERFQYLSEEALGDKVAQEFSVLDFPDPKTRELIVKNRIREIQSAVGEYNRRLSVCWSNLGLVYRLDEEYKLAISSYEQALELWDRNLDAENNLNRLLGRPLKKRNLIQKLFPPSKDG